MAVGGDATFDGNSIIDNDNLLIPDLTIISTSEVNMTANISPRQYIDSDDNLKSWSNNEADMLIV